MIDTLTVSSKGQVVIPEKVRKELKITAGTKLVMQTQNNTLIIQTEKEFEKHLEDEDAVWNELAMQSLEEVWDDDGEEWEKYL